jgi:hypothetical protein
MAKSKLKQRIKKRNDEDAKDEAFRKRINIQRDARKSAAEFSQRRINRRNWIATNLDGGKLGIECPRCHGKAVVSKKRWLFGDTDFISRGCTYCYFLAFIPKKLLPKTDPRHQDAE